ncbi:DUF4974 domain-containing protein [Ginsengibacter hankyongi]|uniref:DUF4974 domain-containing protein n=1 Tax=Ginsengibacter hankyongi TaxID=2607284 RepID=A0A5J5IEC8_9BACT|nr:FecR family protein [Ginsengibacter hankyongi]KAA9037768.1 DUF4974 domain-containing protein [Ginsengibacter hankyongi]
MPTDRIKFLIQLYFDKTIDNSQQSELSEWVKNHASDEELIALLSHAWQANDENIVMPEVASKNILSAVLKSSSSKNQKKDSNKIIPLNKTAPWIKRFVIAASILIVCSIGYFLRKPAASHNAVARNINNTKGNIIKPGGSKATLTLSDGTKIVLDSTGNGLLTKQGGASVIKRANGKLQYLRDQSVTSEVVYNTMSTPVGGMYEVVLPDGSNVWLNSGSSITYPTSFSRNERRVQMTGEAYFEVAHDRTRPFHVSVNNMDVEVLGTHFNINSYDNEPSIKTTLLEGKVKVSKGNATVLIIPGQQAVTAKLSNDLSINKNGVDLDQVVAWKNGKFVFIDDDIKSIMRQIERWYGVSVTYNTNVTNEEFIGVISRSVNITQILGMLEKTGSVKFTIQDRNIIVQ